MKRRLETAESGSNGASAFFLDADTLLNRTDVELEDILVALWSLVYAQAPEAAAKALAPIWKEADPGGGERPRDQPPRQDPRGGRQGAQCYAAAGASLIGLYGGEIVVLPMIEVTKPVFKGGGDNPAGLAAMAELLEKRVRFDSLFAEGHAAAERVARLSGGCIRHALRILQGAINEHDLPPVTAASIDRSAAGVQADFERALPEAWVPILKSVAPGGGFGGCGNGPVRAW